MRILITGSDGQLGQTLFQNLPSKIKNRRVEIIKANKKELDLSNELSCRNLITKIKPEWVINCGAYTSVDKAESEKDLVYKINGYGPYFLAKNLKKIGGKLLHISSDFVFDGRNNKSYEIDHPVNPINIYGESKALGEKLLIQDENLDNFYIIRTSWLLSSIGENFFLTILKLLSKKDEIRVVNDQIGCITLVSNLSNACWEIIKLQSNNFSLPRIMHFSDSGICTWFDVAKTINEFALKKKLIVRDTKIIPVDSKYFNLPAKRPNFSLLNSQKTYEILKYNPFHWRISIDCLLNSLSKQFIQNLNKKDDI